MSKPPQTSASFPAGAEGVAGADVATDMTGPFATGGKGKTPRHPFDRALDPTRAPARITRWILMGLTVAAGGAVVVAAQQVELSAAELAIVLLVTVLVALAALYLLLARNVRTVMKRELRAYFTSPIAIIVFVIFHVAAIVLTFQGFATGIGFWERGYADLVPFFQLLPWLMLVFVPALSMRLWAEERQSGSIEVLLTLPLRPGEALLGKFLGAWGIIAFMLLLPTVSLTALVVAVGQPDLGQIVASYFGAVLMGGAYLALGSFLSALTRDQIVAFVVSVVAAAFFSFLGAEAVRTWLVGLSQPQTIMQFGQEVVITGNPFGLWLAEAADWIALSSRFDRIGRGVLDVTDVLYYAAFIGLFLYANGIALKLKR